MGKTKRAISTAAAVLSLGPGAGKTHAVELKAGDPAPAFSLPGSDGREHALAEHRGKRAVVLAWFPRAFTGGCTKECKSLHANRSLLGDRKNVAYYLASVDDPATNRKFADSLGLTYPILSDPDHKVARAYGVVHEGRSLAERWTFYIGQDGKLLYVDRAVDPDTAAADILNRLDLLGVGTE